MSEPNLRRKIIININIPISHRDIELIIRAIRAVLRLNILDDFIIIREVAI